MKEVNCIIDKHLHEILKSIMIEDLSLTELNKVKDTTKKHILLELYSLTEYVLVELYDMKNQFDTYVDTKLTNDLLRYYNGLS